MRSFSETRASPFGHLQISATLSPQVRHRGHRRFEMLQIDKVQQIEGVIVYGDHDMINVFYPLPQQPRYRLDAQGRPSFAFYKYRFPIGRPDGTKGGGFVLFDIEFVVD